MLLLMLWHPPAPPTHTLMTHDSITGCGPCCCCCLCCCGGHGCGGRNMSVCVSFCRRLANITKRLLMYMYGIYIYFRYRIRYLILSSNSFDDWFVSTASAAHEEEAWSEFFVQFMIVCLFCVCVCVWECLYVCVCVWEEIRAETSNAHELAENENEKKYTKKQTYGFFFLQMFLWQREGGSVSFEVA